MTELEKQMLEAILKENPRDCPLHQVQSTLDRYQQVIKNLYNELKAKTEAEKDNQAVQKHMMLQRDPYTKAVYSAFSEDGRVINQDKECFNLHGDLIFLMKDAWARENVHNIYIRFERKAKQ